MKRTDLITELSKAGFYQKGGSKHDKFTNGKIIVMVPRHKEVSEGTAHTILKQAGIR